MTEHWRKLPREVVESPVDIIQTHLDCSCITCSGDPALAGHWRRWTPGSLPPPAIPQLSNTNLSLTEIIVSWSKRVSSCVWKLNDSSLITWMNLKILIMTAFSVQGFFKCYQLRMRYHIFFNHFNINNFIFIKRNPFVRKYQFPEIQEDKTWTSVEQDCKLTIIHWIYSL